MQKDLNEIRGDIKGRLLDSSNGWKLSRPPIHRLAGQTLFCFCCFGDRAYCALCAVAIRALLKSNPWVENLLVITNEKTQPQLEEALSDILRGSRNFFIHTIFAENIIDYTGARFHVHRLPLPSHLAHVVYMDIDCVVWGDLSALIRATFNTHPIYALEQLVQGDGTVEYAEQRPGLGKHLFAEDSNPLRELNAGFNTGVLVFSMDLARRYFDRVLRTLYAYFSSDSAKGPLHEQACANYILLSLNAVDVEYLKKWVSLVRPNDQLPASLRQLLPVVHFLGGEMGFAQQKLKRLQAFVNHHQLS
ncbi:MAG: hypothetical protein JJT75_08560 [Opitutales bacterium]|nr:hypothetical protein [Opitutales bacterium]MCH8539354.1 hypothetical protein [Opitutales bacterium]